MMIIMSLTVGIPKFLSPILVRACPLNLSHRLTSLCTDSRLCEIPSSGLLSVCIHYRFEMPFHPSGTSMHGHIVLGTYSKDEDRRYCNDRRNRRFLVEPKDDRPNFDLLHGIESYVDRPHRGIRPSSLSPVLKWIRDHKDELVEKGILTSTESGTGKKLNVDFVARRGALSKLLRAGHDTNKVEILVTLHDGTYYIEVVKEDSSKKMTYSGRKFGQYVTSADGENPDITKPVNSNLSYDSIMKADCGPHTIVFSAKTLAERKDSTERPPLNYVDIETSKVIRTVGGQTSFERYRTFQWWSLNYITGVSDIMVGWRDDRQHTITSTEIMKTDELPEKSGGFWDPDVCIRKMTSLLSDIKDMVQDDDPRAVYRLELREVEKGKGVRQRVKSRTFSVCGRREDDYVIVQDWYLKEVLHYGMV